MTKRKTPFVVALAICALSGHAIAELTDADVPKNERQKSGVTFRAKVVDSQSGEPVQGICLWSPKHPKVEGISDAKGQIAIPGMSPGEFRFKVTGRERMDAYRKKVRVARRYDANGYARWWSEQCVSERQRFYEYKSGWQRNFDYLDFDIRANMPLVTIKVEKAVRIRGKVVDPDGKPVAGATVAPANGRTNSITGDTRYSYVTKEDGSFEAILPASKKSKYNLIAHDGAYKQWRKWANGVGELLATKPGEVVEDVVLRLSPMAVIRGTVKDLSGKPVAGHKVRVVNADLRGNDYYDPETKTDKKGRFELKFARPGKQYVHTMHFWRNGPVGPRVGPAYGQLEGPRVSPAGSFKLVKLAPGDMNNVVDLVVDVDPKWVLPF